MVSKKLCLILIALIILPFSAMAENNAKKDFEESCAPCHGAGPRYPILGARLGYDQSGHKNSVNSYYANGAGCQICHTNEGFIDHVKTGKVDPEAFVAYPSQPGCVTCHTMHETWDFSLRTTKPVTLEDGSELDIGKGNLCAVCHRARYGVASQIREMGAEEVSRHWGAHMGPQSDIVNGTNAYEFPGKAYSGSPHKEELDHGCVTCHMSLPQGRYALSPELGGHSFNIVGKVHHAEKINVSGCGGCHEDMKQQKGTQMFDIKAEADYDRDGIVEAVQMEVQGLLDTLVNKSGTGYLQTVEPPMYKENTTATFVDLSPGWAASKNGKWSKVQVGALWNYKLIVEDRSRGVHNATYTIQVLYDTIKALDSTFDDSLRPE